MQANSSPITCSAKMFTSKRAGAKRGPLLRSNVWASRALVIGVQRWSMVQASNSCHRVDTMARREGDRRVAAIFQNGCARRADLFARANWRFGANHFECEQTECTEHYKRTRKTNKQTIHSAFVNSNLATIQLISTKCRCPDIASTVAAMLDNLISELACKAITLVIRAMGK